MLQSDYEDDIQGTVDNFLRAGKQSASEALRHFKEWIRCKSYITVFEADMLERRETQMLSSALVVPTPTVSPEVAGPVLSASDISAVVAAGYLVPKRDSKAVGRYRIAHPKVSIGQVLLFRHYRCICDGCP